MSQEVQQKYWMIITTYVIYNNIDIVKKFTPFHNPFIRIFEVNFQIKINTRGIQNQYR